MSRAAQRDIKKAFQKDIVEFLRIQHHFLPTFIEDLGGIKDPRKIAYADYDIEEILYTVIMKNICSITSMQDMTDSLTMRNAYAI